MLILNLFEELEGPPEPTLVDALRDFLPLAIKHLELKKLPKIKLLDEVETEHMPSFGKFSNDDRTIHLGIKNRHPNDILRTLAHEMVHYAQGEHGQLEADSGATGSPEEDQANAEAGVIMREFNQQFPQYMELKPIMLEKWSKKYKKSINCSNPKGFSQKAHCAGRKKNTNEAEQKPKLYTGEELDIRVHLLSKQLGMSPAEVRRQYTDPMIKDGRIKLVPSKVQEDQNKCPPATQDITLNLKNRQKAIDEYGYGPLNPDLPNTKFWMKKVDEWNLDSAEEAKSSLCGNCAAFDLRKDTLDCIAQGIDSESPEDAQGTIDAGELGYCKFLKFKCASRRTCDAWVTGGPLVDKPEVTENLRDWFGKDKWVRMDTKGKIKGPCAREPGEGKPKCLPQAKAHALGKKGRAAAAQKKRREDPDPNRRGPAKNVATKVREQATRRDPKDLTAPTDQELDKLHHKFIPTWSMLDHDLLATAYDFQDDDTALSYVNQLDDVEQSMDHNAVITIDNARVSIKVRTGDIDGLSRLDFEFALRANNLAKQLQADQLAHATNAINEQQFDENCWKGYHKEGNKKMFGKTVPNCVKNENVLEGIPFNQCPQCGGEIVHESMLNEKQDACYHKVKSRYKVWPSAYASGALVQCRKKGAANWGNKSKNESAELGKHCSVKNAVPELKAALTKRKSELKNADAKVAYDKIDKIMTRIAQTYNISGQKLHDLWTERYGEIPDTWVLGESKETRQALSDQHFEFPQQGQYGYRTGYQERGVLELADGRTGKIINLGEFGDFDDEYKPNQKWLRIVFTNPNMDDNAWNELEDMLWSDNQVSENFADGKNPQDKGDSQRHGIPKGATISQLEKASHSAGRKGQLARWQLNMRRGHKK